MKTKSTIRTTYQDEDEEVPAKIFINYSGEIALDREKSFETLRAFIKTDYKALTYCRSIGYELPYDDKDVTNIPAANEIAAYVLGALLRARVAEVLDGMERSMHEKAGPVTDDNVEAG